MSLATQERNTLTSRPAEQYWIMSPDPEDFHRRLQANHFARISHGISESEIQLAADTFLAFLALPDTTKRQLHFPARSHRASADGFTDKTLVEQKDPKQFFHWSPSIASRKPCTYWTAKEPVVENFFQAASRIYSLVETALLSVYSQFLPEYQERIFADGRLIDGILRFLCYAPRPQRAFCAQAHFDKGFSTLALADSAPGLRIGCCNAHPLTAVEHKAGYGIFMPAWMIFQASGGDIKPAWHDVVHEPGVQNVNSICARWSIVFFVNDPQTPFTSWDAVHTPLH